MATWLVVGLGNPGPTYAAHRHNVGAMVIALLAERGRTALSAQRLMRADTAEVKVGPTGTGAVGQHLHHVVLMRPRTYMNESGGPVAKVMQHFKVDPGNLIVVHDELDLDMGQLRCKFGGGDNGHNGLKSLRKSLGTGDYHRVRFGIGRPPGRQDPADFVLADFPKAVAGDIAVELERAADAVEALITVGLEQAQQRFNS